MAKIKKMTDWKVVIGIQIVATLVTLGALFYLNVLPMWLFIIVAVVLVALVVGLFVMMKPAKGKRRKKKATPKEAFGKLISLVLSIVLIMGSTYAINTGNFLSHLKSEGDISRISVMVLKTSNIKKLDEIKGASIEADTKSESAKMEEAVEALKKEVSVEINNTTDYAKMANDLYDGKTKALFVDEAYYAMLEADHENFQTETEVLWTYEYLNPESTETTKPVDVTTDPFIVYISGIDTKGKVSTKSRSDVNMLVTVNPKTHKILLTSIPRDYYVTLADQNAKDKLTHSGLNGTSNTVRTVENFTGLKINYYVRVNFTSVEKIVDALGGVTVDVPKSFTSGVDGTQFTKGVQNLNGAKALKFCRERYAFGGGDGARVKNQRTVMTAILKKAMSPAILSSYNSLLRSVDGYIETDMSADDITNIIKAQINSGASWTISQDSQMQAKGKLMKGGYYIPNKALYYGIPVQSSVDAEVAKINDVLAGK